MDALWLRSAVGSLPANNEPALGGDLSQLAAFGAPSA